MPSTADPTNFNDHDQHRLLRKKGHPVAVLRLPAQPFVGADDPTLAIALDGLAGAVNALPAGRYTILAAGRPGGLQEMIRRRSVQRGLLTTSTAGALADERLEQLRELHTIGGGARETEYLLCLEHRDATILQQRVDDLCSLFGATALSGLEARKAEARLWRAGDLLPPTEQWQAPSRGDALLHRTVPQAPRVIPDGWDGTDDEVFKVRHAFGGSRHCWSFCLLMLPPAVEPGWLHELLHLEERFKGAVPARVRLAMTIEPYSPAAANLFLKYAEGAHTSTVNTFAKMGWNRSRRSEQAMHDVDRVADRVAQAATRLFRLSLIGTLEALTAEALEEAKRRCYNWLNRRVVEDQGPTWADLWMRHYDGFRATTLCGPHAPAVRSLTDTLRVETDAVIYAWPCAGTSVSMPAGPFLGLGLGEAHGQPFHYDVFAEQEGLAAGHTLILAGTGAGKSTLVATIAAEEHLRPPEERAHVSIVDPKGDFPVLCAALGGQHLSMSEDPTTTFNVFDLAPPIKNARGRVSNPVKEQVAVVLGMVAQLCGGLDPKPAAITRECVRNAYAAMPEPILPDAPWTWTEDPARMPTLATLYDVLRTHSAAGADVAQLLESYAVGEYAGLFSRQTNAAREHFLTVYGLQELPAELQPAVVYLIAAHQWRLARRTVRRRIWVFDEVSALLSDDATAHLIADIHRKGRSFGVACFTSALEFDPYLRTESGKACLNGALTTWLGRQSAQTIDTVTERYHLSPANTKWLATLKKADAGSFLIDSPRGQQRVKIVPPPSVIEWLTEAMRLQEQASMVADAEDEDDTVIFSRTPLELAAG